MSDVKRSPDGASDANRYSALESSRRELLKFLSNHEQQRALPNDESRSRKTSKRTEAGDDVIDWSEVASSGLKSWWRDHPARGAALVAQSAIEGFVRARPFTAVSIAAAVGIGLVLTKPWKLMATRSVMLGLVSSSSFGSVARSVFESAAHAMYKKERR
jgi:ElaB/YqjD/DUF883 family membrane-anchored ribosome-binding protein